MPFSIPAIPAPTAGKWEILLNHWEILLNREMKFTIDHQMLTFKKHLQAWNAIFSP
jgi:hypothetical protein